MSKEIKVAKEVAEQDFDRMCEDVGIETDLTGEDLEGFEKLKAALVKAIMVGSLVINDSGLPTYTTIKNGDHLEFIEPTGATLLAMDKVKEGQDMRKTYTVIGELTSGKFVPSKCNMKDIKVLTSIMSLFIAG